MVQPDRRATRDAALLRACERALVAGARAAGTRQQVRAAARRFARRHRRDSGYLAWALRSAAASSAIAIVLLGLDTPAGAALPPFAAHTGAANPLNGQSAGGLSAPGLGDLDGDGDLDLVVGDYDGFFSYFENTGSAANPIFVPRTGTANPLSGLDVGQFSDPALGDLDGDHDLDLVSSEDNGRFFYFENTGSAASPAFAPRTGAVNPLDGQVVEQGSFVALGDLDRDGDLDVVSGDIYGRFSTFENVGNAIVPAFVRHTGSANPLDGQIVGVGSFPALGDLDGDGDPDLVAGENTGAFRYFESFVTPWVPASQRTGAANPLAGQDVGALAGPALADLDRDGDADLVAGEQSGTFRFFENTGSVRNPTFALRSGAADPLNGRDVGDFAKPGFGDLDGDGDLDLIAGRRAGDFAYLENTGDAVTPLFAAPVTNPFGLSGVASDTSVTALGDLDADGDLDLIAGEYYGGFSYFENTGSRTNTAFVKRLGSANPLNGVVLAYVSPLLGDFDRDGDLDLLVGAFRGRLFYFRNVGGATSPVFVPQIGAPNPLDGQDVGDFSAPAAADLDGDGDLDLVVGASDGTFHVYYFPEPARGLLLAAGAGLLSLLDRARRAHRANLPPAPRGGRGTRGVIRLLHSGDWQLGMTRSVLGDEAQARFADARIAGVRRLGELARAERCESSERRRKKLDSRWVQEVALRQMSRVAGVMSRPTRVTRVWARASSRAGLRSGSSSC